jgi:hypothetical protein
LANKITVTYLNVCGLKSKLLIPEFLDLIKLYDIIFFCETKLDSYDLPEGYSFATKIRKKFARKSGGIITIYKKIYEKLIKYLNSESEYVQWVELTDLISSVNKKVLFGCVYVPPQNSKYSSEGAFNEIENEYIDFSKNLSTHC